MPLIRPGNLGGSIINPGWTPLNLSSLACWYDFSQGITLNGSTVSQANDLSGNSRHLSQGTANKQPLYVTGAVNGYSAIRFDGSNDLMKSTSFTLSGAITVVMIMKYVAYTVNGYVFNGLAENQYLVGYQHPSSGSARMFNGSFGPYVSAGIGTYRLIVAVFNGASSEMYLNGVASGLGLNPGTSGSATGITLGGAYSDVLFSNVEVAELFVMSSAAGTAARQNIETYANNKYRLY